MYQILADESKFQKLSNDPTILREGKLQRFLRKLNKEGFFLVNNYMKVFIRLVHNLPDKVKRKSEMPPFRPII